MKFREYLNCIEDEHDLALSSNKIYHNVKEELTHRPMEEVESVVTFTNTTTKVDLKAWVVTDRSEYIIVARKLIGKHNNMKNFQNKTNSHLNNVKRFKVKFLELTKNCLPSFWDGQEYFIF